METQINSVYLSLLKRLDIFPDLRCNSGTIIFSFAVKFHHTHASLSYSLFIAVTLISTNLLIRSSQKKFIRYLNVYLLTTVIRLFLYVAVMVTYILLNKPDILPFSITFFILYLCYTIFEVFWLVSFSRTDRLGNDE